MSAKIKFCPDYNHQNLYFINKKPQLPIFIKLPIIEDSSPEIKPSLLNKKVVSRISGRPSSLLSIYNASDDYRISELPFSLSKLPKSKTSKSLSLASTDFSSRGVGDRASTELIPNIKIDSQNELFLTIVRDALNTINSKPIGKQFIEEYSNRIGKTIIRESLVCDAVSTWYGNFINLSPSSFICSGKNGQGIALPFFIALAHELLHVFHWHELRNYPQFEDKFFREIWTNEKEYQVIEAGSAQFPQFTENAIRKEHALPKRCSH